MIEPITIGAITLYQRHLSPHKGFSCPHRLLHGGESCSGYVKRLILEQGLVAAIWASRVRFAARQEARYVPSTTLANDGCIDECYDEMVDAYCDCCGDLLP